MDVSRGLAAPLLVGSESDPSDDSGTTMRSACPLPICHWTAAVMPGSRVPRGRRSSLRVTGNVRVGVFTGRFAVGSPARVRNARGARVGFLKLRAFQFRHLALTLVHA